MGACEFVSSPQLTPILQGKGMLTGPWVDKTLFTLEPLDSVNEVLLTEHRLQLLCFMDKPHPLITTPPSSIATPKPHPYLQLHIVSSSSLVFFSVDNRAADLAQQSTTTAGKNIHVLAIGGKKLQGQTIGQYQTLQDEGHSLKIKDCPSDSRTVGAYDRGMALSKSDFYRGVMSCQV